MKISFLDESGKKTFLEKDSKELVDILNLITREGMELKLDFGKDCFIHGYVVKTMYNYNEEKKEDILKIYISESYNNIKLNINKAIKEINENIEYIKDYI